jgi:hypothetical protein
MRALWRESFAVRTEADRRLADAFPNPQRAGCPGLWLLCSAALHQLPDDHPTYAHLAACSPCYREARGIQQMSPSKLVAWRRRISKVIRFRVLRMIRGWRDAELRRASRTRVNL